MANETSSANYIYTFKLISGFNVINIPNNVIVPNLKQIFIRKLAYNFDQIGSYIGLLSIQGYDLHVYTDGITPHNYTICLFNPSGNQNQVIEYINETTHPDINLVYGAPMSQFTLIFDQDGPSANQQPSAAMTTGGSPFITTTNPLFIELEFVSN